MTISEILVWIPYYLQMETSIVNIILIQKAL